MRRYKIWILKLVPGFPYGGWFAAVLIFSLLYSFFSLANSGQSTDDRAAFFFNDTPALFFSLIIAYIIPVFSFITARSEEALLKLLPLLPANGEAPPLSQDKLRTVSGKILLFQLLGGTGLGIAHLSFIRGSVTQVLQELLYSLTSVISVSGTILVWVVMFTAISSLVQQALLFAKLGANVRISLLNTQALVAFGRVAIFSSLAIIGALAMFPLMNLNSQFDMAESLPGALATVGPLIMIFFITIWPVHKRLTVLKKAAIEALTVRLDTHLGDDDGTQAPPEKMADLTALLAYRREINQVSTWPFDLSSMARLSLYLVIVPLTWAGAALIERLVDLFV